MMMDSERETRERVQELTGRKIYGAPQVWEDTTQFIAICGGMIVRLAGIDYFVTGDAREGRFGIDDQPKQWVKYAVDLDSGRRKILKFVFHEEVVFHVGPHPFPGRRSSDKEARVLDVVRGHPNFMQGVWVRDAAGNRVRVIDFQPGASVYERLRSLRLDHEEYFCNELPGIMAHVLEAFEGIEFLRQRGEHHGDIRNDHLLMDPDTGRPCWIDFDYEMSNPDYDIWCMGNVLTCVIGKGNRYFKDFRKKPAPDPCSGEAVFLTPEDSLLFFRHRICNLRKLFPYIPDRLNRVLLRFSAGTPRIYESVRCLIDEVREACP